LAREFDLFRQQFGLIATLAANPDQLLVIGSCFKDLVVAAFWAFKLEMVIMGFVLFLSFNQF
jgi:hypothetical protein